MATNKNHVNVGCGPHYAKGWWNIDVLDSDEHDIHPDEIVDGVTPFATIHGADMICLGHVMEHVPWRRLPNFLNDARHALALDGRLCVIGPDVMRAIDRWHRGFEPWAIVEACLEHAGGPNDDGPLRHQWNCHERRAIKCLQEAGFTDVRAVPMTSSLLDPWPVVSRAQWQFAVLAEA